jgi:hypothetical protein
MAISDCVSWKPLLNGSAQGFRNEVTRAMRYGTSITSNAMAPAHAAATSNT